MTSRTLLDLNYPEFQEGLFALEKEELASLFATLRKIRKLDWSQLYADGGLRWEAILSRLGPGGRRIYSFRVTKRNRVVAFREGDTLRLLSIHPDHDSAY
jgi:hypothetical protein